MKEKIRTKHCKSTWSQIRGLMFSQKKDAIFYFKKSRRVSLHNFFVFFPLNLVFLDENKKVIEIKKRFLPFTFYTSKKKAKYLIETPFEINYTIGEKINSY